MENLVKRPLYAIVDIETTGGQIANGSITEIAIRIHDGECVVDRYETLVRPFYSIPRSITVLTGIDDEMVANSPTFEEIAGEVYELLKDKVFVAHNVNFDHSFIQKHLAAAGYDLKVDKLCTVRLGRKVFPGLRSYSLGNICAYLGIVIENRHRAGGDTDATTHLFERILQADDEGHIGQLLKKGSGERYLPPNLPWSAIEHLPRTPGIYYFHDEKGKVIYVGKAKDILKRVRSHFTGNKITRQRQDFLRDIYNVSFESCATELMALVMEAQAIKKIWPKHNRSLKSFEPKYGLFRYIDQNDLQRLFIGKYNRSTLPLRSFYDVFTARSFLHQLVEKYGLCPELCKVGDCEACRSRAVTIHSDAGQYNKLVEVALEEGLQAQNSFFIHDVGRNDDESSVIWVEPGHFYAMGYLPGDVPFSDEEVIRQLLTPFEGSFYINQLLVKFAKEHPAKVHHLQQ